MLRTGRLSDAQTAHGLEVIDRNLTVQTKVIADLLDVSRIIAGKLQLERRPMDIRAAVQEALEQVRHQADDRGVSIATTLPPQAARVDGDPARLVQIVGNLVANAVKFTPRAGRVSVEVALRDRVVAITVADTGIGIPAEVLPHIFERFHQAQAGGGVRGLGLGLTIVRNLVDLHDGRIEVVSEGEGCGSRFIVTLPRFTRTLDVPDDVRLPDERRLPREGLRVLVVEDEPDSLEMLTTFLAARGLTVTGAASVEEALATWTRQPFDALVSDLRMPGRDGYALVREIRARDDGKRVRAVAVSANAAAQDMQRSLIAGFDVHLAKPIDPEDLLAALA
jgi:CheY-like chemotaxis protein/anti-sigma regulatory factor (Ser/Thr protein kinase)